MGKRAGQVRNKEPEKGKEYGQRYMEESAGLGQAKAQLYGRKSVIAGLGEQGCRVGDIDGPGWGKRGGRALVKCTMECLQGEKNTPGDQQKRVPVRRRGDCRRRAGRAAEISFLLRVHSPLWLGIVAANYGLGVLRPLWLSPGCGTPVVAHWVSWHLSCCLRAPS